MQGNTERFETDGIDLNRPPDSVKPKRFPLLQNMRVTTQGQLEPRFGLQDLGLVVSGQTPLHSIRRLNGLSSSFTYILGAGTHLADGQSFPFTDRDSGYSGDPLSLVPWRPDQATIPYMYVADRLRMRKLSVSGQLDTIGYLAPNNIPDIALSQNPAYQVVDTLGSTGGWSTGGEAGTLVTSVRVGTTIQAIKYDVGTTGWASIVPVDINGIGKGGRLDFNPSGGNEENQTIQDVFAGSAVGSNTTTIASIIYDSGTSGGCSVVLTTPIIQAELESLGLNATTGEYSRVIGVVTGPDGTISLRFNTSTTWAAGNTFQIVNSFRAYLGNTHVAGETIQELAISFTVTKSSTGIGYITKTVALDLSKIANGIASHPDDYMHIGLRPSNAALVTDITVLLDVSDGSFSGDYYKKVVSGDIAGTKSTNGWSDIRFRLSDLTRVGNNLNKTLQNVVAIRIQMTVASSFVVLDQASWWIGGGFGPDADSTTSTPYLYRYRVRSQTTGAASNFSPATRLGLSPHRQSVNISLTQYPAPSGTNITASTDLVLDIERFGGEIASWHYLSTISNTATPTFVDTLPDSTVAALAPLTNDHFQPWPTIQGPVSGQVNVSGTSVTSSALFNTGWAPGTLIHINGIVYTIYRIVSTSLLELVENAGNQTNVTFRIDEPLLLGQPLPCLWGDEDFGTTFACGDPANPGRLYVANHLDPDSTRDTYFIDITSPSEPLQNGLIWNGRSYVYSSERGFQILPDSSAIPPYRIEEIPGTGGLFNRWGLDRSSAAPFMTTLVKDGINANTGGIAKSLTDEDLYPLFPNEGNIGILVNGVPPPSIIANEVPNLRAAYYDNYIYFDYTVTGLVITSCPVSPIQTGTPFSFQFTEVGGVAPFTWIVSAGSLPPGLTLSSSGLLSGTPTTPGSFSYVVQVTDGNGNVGTISCLLVTFAPLLTGPCPSSSLPLFVFFTYTFSVSGGTSPYTWTLLSGSFPQGLSLSSSGVLSGTPTEGGTFAYTVRVTDSVGRTADLSCSFTTTLAPCAGFTNVGLITIDRTKLPSTQANFIIPVVFTNVPQLRTIANGGFVQDLQGDDIRFSSTSCSNLTFEREVNSYDPVTGSGIFHVLVPIVNGANASSNTQILVNFGNPALTTDGSSISTWSGYNSVVHMNAIGPGIICTRDSVISMGDTDWSNVGGSGVTLATGQIGNCGSFTGGAELRRVSGLPAQPFVGTGQGRATFWLKSSVSDSYILGKVNFLVCSSGTTASYWFTQITSTGKFFTEFRNNGWTQIHNVTSNATINDGALHKLTVYRDGATIKLYIDGILDKTDVGANVTMTDDGGNLELGVIGFNVCGHTVLNALIDEFRQINGQVWTDDAELSEYNAQHSPSTFSTRFFF